MKKRKIVAASILITVVASVEVGFFVADWKTTALVHAGMIIFGAIMWSIETLLTSE